ncbi:MAG TPA: XdhC/CoxI family protein [Thermoplasmata archaeon]|nr:XdhC/CoxI family protein [Thermoplasmata archaeon]
MNRRLAREAVRLLDLHVPFVRATVVKAVGSVPGKLGASMILRPDGTFLGTIGGAGLEEQVKAHARTAMVNRTGDLFHFDLKAWKPGGLPSLCGGSVDVAVEYVPAHPNLLLWGGGHVAHALAELLPALEYDFSVADDRPEWVSAERFPEADRREAVRPSEVWTVFDPSEFSHLYLLGYDAKKDLEVLTLSVERFPGYIGLIASASKRAHMFTDLRRQGVSAAAIARVHAPVGLAIGAESPAEIAVAIVAEVIRSVREPTGRRAPNRGSVPPTPEVST